MTAIINHQVTQSLAIVLCATTLLFSNNSLANSSATNNSQLQSVSAGQLSQQLTELDRDILLKNTHNLVNIQASTNNGIERSQYLALKNSKKSTIQKVMRPNNNHENYQFAIYNAQSKLITDIDYDGYYQSFSVTFDADYLRYDDYDSATVYAEMYLSKNGGPWTHYFTTDNFTIHSDDSTDDYEVITTLVDGYSSDNYDVLIDLYEVGYNDIVASYSSNESNALYALPLESANYDVYETIEVSYSEESGGSFSLLSLLLVPLIMIRKNFR